MNQIQGSLVYCGHHHIRHQFRRTDIGVWRRRNADLCQSSVWSLVRCRTSRPARTPPPALLFLQNSIVKEQTTATGSWASPFRWL